MCFSSVYFLTQCHVIHPLEFLLGKYIYSQYYDDTYTHCIYD